MAVTDTDRSFREHVRAWLAEHAAAYRDQDAPQPDVETARAFLASLQAARLVGITWPTEYGGAGRGESDENLFAVESAGYDLPLKVFRIGLGTIGPTIRDLGTPEQKAALLPDILTGATIWCQLFSEPEAGSDLAGLRTSATKVEGGWVVTGRKVWTSGAHQADRAILLARTDASVPKHAGLTMFLLDMHQDGVTVRPLVDVSGRAFFNEVVIEGAFVPDTMVLGDLGGGWAAASHTLQHERAAVAVGLGKGDRDTDATSVANLLAIAAEQGRQLGDTDRAALLDLFVADRLVAHLRLRMTQEAEAGRPIGARGSVTKLVMGRQEIERAKLAARVLGPLAVIGRGDSANELMQTIISSTGLAIAGGTEEIQKNIIAERLLGLPREPDPFKGRPFRELRVTGEDTGGDRS